jgi:tetratricopeptide (TPR) repeat protein
VERAVDDDERRWRAARSEVCVAHVTAGDGAGARGPRSECLEQRRAEALALLEAFSHSAYDTVERAVGAVHALTPVDECARDALRHQVAVDPDRAERVSGIRMGLAQALALFEAGRYHDSLVHAGQAYLAAGGLADAALAAEALFHRGRAEDRSGRLDDAVATLFEAALQAETAGRNEIAVRAWSHRAFLVGVPEAPRRRSDPGQPACAGGARSARGKRRPGGGAGERARRHPPGR